VLRKEKNVNRHMDEIFLFYTMPGLVLENLGAIPSLLSLQGLILLINEAL
jgi:hypothetical protein